MKSSSPNSVKEHYQTLRQRSPSELWSCEVPAFNSATQQERLRSVSVIRAVGVVFSESGSAAQKSEALEWLRGLVADPQEKIRRYAMAAMPKLGSGEAEEKTLLGLAPRAASVRESEILAKTLGRIGGRATLAAASDQSGVPLNLDRQKLQANIARRESSDGIDLDALVPLKEGVRITLECRDGMEALLADELASDKELAGMFEQEGSQRGRLRLTQTRPFTLRHLYKLRCFSELSFSLGALHPLSHRRAPLNEAEIARILSSDLTFHLLSHLTHGAIRYRLELLSRRAEPATIGRIACRVFHRQPQLLNDSREALWEVQISESARGVFVNLLPRLRPDPRFAYRQGDVPAASHPPLAAALARIAKVGAFARERIWDPFCGSGLELAECLLFQRSADVFGTDLSRSAIGVARANLAAVLGEKRDGDGQIRFAACDFREGMERLGLDALTLMITNPPLGKRVPVGDLREMMEGVFECAERVLVPGGRLVVVNPLDLGPRGGRLRLETAQAADLGFAHLRIERYAAIADRLPVNALNKKYI